MKKSNLFNLMQRYVTGQVTEEEKKKIEAWLDVKKTEEGTDMLLSESDEERLFRLISSRVGNAEDVKKFRPAGRRFLHLPVSRWLQVAATFTVIALASYFLFLNKAEKTTPHETLTTVAAGKAILDDGTIVWLGKESRLTYVKKGGTRHATLSGTGLFEVAKDPSSPFVVSCGLLSVKVVGTSFHLNSLKDGIEVKVLTGKVNVSSPADAKGIDVLPNEVAIGSLDGGIRKTRMSDGDAQTLVAATEYNMTFRNAKLDDVAARIEEKFEVSVVLEDPEAGTCRITGDFTDHSLDNTLAILKELLDIRYSVTGKVVTITGNGCKR